MSAIRRAFGPVRPLRAPVLAVFLWAALGCESAERISSPAPDDPPHAPATLSSSGLPGIPFGTFAQPLSVYGPTYTGGHLNPLPETLLSQLASIKAAGGRVALALAGGPTAYINPDGTFNFELWKGRLDRYSGIDFSSYISDGTVLGIFLIDQPSCPTCWGGQAIPQDMVEAMAQYSKSLWPTMTTLARVDPTWLAAWAGPYVYLDAGWGQYVVRKGDVSTYLTDNVAAAQSRGLGLVLGLNVLGGGLDGANMSASQLKNFGSVLLGSSYACGLISWKYDAAYFSRTDIKSAVALLSKKAKRHAATSCSQ